MQQSHWRNVRQLSLAEGGHDHEFFECRANWIADHGLVRDWSRLRALNSSSIEYSL